MIYIIGMGATAREAYQLMIDNEMDTHNLCYVVSEGTYLALDWQEREMKNVKTFSQLVGSETGLDDQFIIAVGGPELKYALRKRLLDAIGTFRRTPSFNLVHPSLIKSDGVDLGRGNIVMPGCLMSVGVRLSEHIYVSFDCSLGHDVSIHDYCTITPGVHLSGNVVVGQGTFIGTGANVIPNVKIGAWSVIGAGCTVIEDVPPNSVVVGVPGKVIKTKKVGWHEA